MNVPWDAIGRLVAQFVEILVARFGAGATEEQLRTEIASLAPDRRQIDADVDAAATRRGG